MNVNLNLETFRWIMQSFKAMVMLGLTIACLIGLFLIVIPQGLETFETQSYLETKRNELNSAAAKLSALKDLDETELEANLLILLKSLPEKVDVPHIISTITISS